MSLTNLRSHHAHVNSYNSRQIMVDQLTSASVPCPVCGGGTAFEYLQSTDKFHCRKERYRLLRCPACSLVWLERPPGPDEMDQHYGAEYDRAIAAAGESSPDRWEARKETLSHHKSCGALLDIGCSSGCFLETMRSSSWGLHGIEISPSIAETAKERSGAQVFVGDIQAAPFPRGSFDVITCFHVYEHLYEPLKVMAKVRDWLKPGGIFYFLVPNIDSAAARVFGRYWYGLELPRHLFHFSPTSLRIIAKMSGLEEVSLSTHREPFIEYSTRYIFDSALEKLGIHRPPLSRAIPRSIPRRLVRKAFRMTALPVLSAALSLVGEGESIHAILRKPI